MRRESLDTNVLLRLMLRTSSEHYEQAKELVSRPGIRFVISDTAIVEFVFALRRHYLLERHEIAQMVEALMSMRLFESNRRLIQGALDLYLAHKSLSFEDCYLASKAESQNATPLWTFDKDLAKKARTAQLVPMLP